MIAGIFFSVLAAVALNGGNVIQKHALNSLPGIAAEEARHLVRTLASSRLWLAGFVICLVGIGFQVMAFALAPLAVVQSIFSASIVLLIVLSRFRLHERLQAVEWAGITVVVISVIAISVTLGSAATSGGVANSPLRILVALIPTIILVMVLVAGIDEAQRSGAFRFGIAAGLLYGAAALGTKGASTLVAKYGVVPAISHIALSIYPYLFVAASILAMLIYQVGIQRFRITVVGALSDVVNSTYVVAIGTVVFSGSLPRGEVMLALRLGGFVGVLIGTLLIAAGGKSDKLGGLPVSESDVGLGPVLIGEAGIATVQPIRQPGVVPDLFDDLWRPVAREG